MPKNHSHDFSLNFKISHTTSLSCIIWKFNVILATRCPIPIAQFLRHTIKENLWDC